VESVAAGCQAGRAEAHWARRLLGAAVAAWRGSLAKARARRAASDTGFSQHQMSRLRLSFAGWIHITQELKINKHKRRAADIHCNRTLMKKIIKEWQRTTALLFYKKEQKNNLLQDSTSHMNNFKLLLFWRKWRTENEKSKKEADMTKMADDFHNKMLATKVMDAWKDYSKLSLRKKLLQRQSEWFRDVRVAASSFLVWRHRLLLAREEAQDTQLALWHWSLVLQRKVLEGWQSFTH